MAGYPYAVPDRPGRRPLPPPTNDPPAPSLPPRPGGKGPRQLPPPQEPGEIYDDCEEQLPQQPVLPQRPVGRTLPQPHLQDEVYDDCNEERETQQLPSEEVYDDFEEERQEKQLPKRLGIPLPPHPAAPPEESYDDLENLGPVVVQPKKLIASRNLPPPPPSASQPSSAEQDNVYEVSPDFEEEPSSPPLPPKSDSKPSKPAPKAPSLPTAGFLVDQSQINALKSNLRKVSVDTPKNTPHEPKEYGDNHSMTELHQIFQQKIKNSESSDKRDNVPLKPVIREKPQLPPTKPIVPVGKPPGAAPTPASPSLSANVSAEAKSQPLHSPPEIAFLPKPLKENKTASGAPPPLPPLAKAPTAVLSPVTKQQLFDDADEIYDDASSADLLDRFDWYHGTIDRKEGELRVKTVGEDGTYLVRISSKNTKFPYTLVVLHQGYASNLHVRLRNDQKYALGDEKDDEMAFRDLPEMISHHQKHPVLLMGNIKSQVTLQKTPKK